MPRASYSKTDDVTTDPLDTTIVKDQANEVTYHKHYIIYRINTTHLIYMGLGNVDRLFRDKI